MSKKSVSKSKSAVALPLASPLLPPVLRRKSWLRSSCAMKAMQALLAVPAAVSLGVTLARPAHAQTTINSDKTNTVNLASGSYAGNPFSITSGTTISTGSGNGVYGDNTLNWTLSNAGTILATAAKGVYFRNGGTVSNTDSLSSIYGNAYGIDILGTLGTVLNNGTITGHLDNGVHLGEGGYVNNGSTGAISGGGIKIENAAGTVINAGSIYGVDAGVLLKTFAGSLTNLGVISQGNSSSTDAAVIMYGGYLQNMGSNCTTNGGTITGYSAGVIATGTTAITIQNGGTIGSTGTANSPAGTNGIIIGAAGGTINNYGTAKIFSDGYAAILTRYGTLNVTNGGTISGGKYGINAYSETTGIGGTVAVSNSGLINGSRFGIYVNTGAGTVTNTGTIIGTDRIGVDLEYGGYVTNASSASIQGYAEGVFIGSLASTLFNSGVITQNGTSFNDAAVKMFGGYLENSGTNCITAPGTIIGFSNGVIAEGADAMTINNSGSIIGIGGSYGDDQYIRANGIVLGAAGGAVTNNNSAVVTGETGNGILSNYGSFSVANSGTIWGRNYGIDAYIPRDSTISQTGSVSITNSNLIEGLNGGMYVATGTASISNSGSIIGIDYNGIELGAGGTITNGTSTAGGGAVIAGWYNGIYAFNAPVSVTNYGTITGTYASGIQLKAGGTVSNLNWYDPEVAGGIGTISASMTVFISAAEQALFLITAASLAR